LIFFPPFSNLSVRSPARFAQNVRFGDFPAALFYSHRDENDSHSIWKSCHELHFRGGIDLSLDCHLDEFSIEGRTLLGAIGFIEGRIPART
jgi:hypothetical protein